MPLTPGGRIGPYEIVAPLGAGGMGEVYRARDTRLHRDVAIKALPDVFLTDRERVTRFEREAQLLATLNHPHIASIYGVEQAPIATTAGSGSSHLLVLEYIDGESLAERLAAGSLPVGQAIAIGRQVADALEQAHEKGIIHRDLKPANIMLTAEDQVKVLDFGLARELDSPTTAIANSPTATVGATAAGTILGTAAYMAPEQIKGRTADRRSDVWAFGCVLYEMLAGAAPFRGEGVSEILAAILRDDPDFGALPRAAPPALHRLVQRCLQKDRQARIHDMAVVRFVLDEIASGATSEASADTRGPRANRRAIAVAAAGLVCGAALASVAIWSFVRDRRPVVVHSSRVPLETMTGPLIGDLQIGTAEGSPFAISPDGRHLAYVGRPSPNAPVQLMVRSFDRLDAIPLPGTIGARYPFFSPSGEWVAYWSPDGVWRKSSRTGGTPFDIWRGGAVGRGGAWLPDNTVILSTSAVSTGLIRVSTDGGEPTILTRPAPGELDHVSPSVLPGGRAVLFTIVYQATGDVAVLDLQTGKTKIVVKGGASAEYVNSGHLVYGVPGALRAVRFDLSRLQVIGDAVPVVEGVMTTSVGIAYYAVSPEGTLVFAPGTAATAARRSLAWVDRSGRAEVIPAALHAYTHPRLSHDDTRLAVVARDDDADVWLWDFRRLNIIKLTSGAARELNPVWMPGDNDLLFASYRPGRVSNVFSVRADGSGREDQLTSSATSLFPISVTTDGSKAVVVESPESGPQGLRLLDLVDKAKTTALLLTDTTFRIINGELSPDSHWMAYQSNETGREEIYVRPFPNVDGPKTPVGTGTKPVWCRTGKELFYIDSDGYLIEVPVETGASFRSGIPHRIFDTRYFVGELGRTYDVSGDCQRFLMLQEEPSASGGTHIRMILVLDWRQEVQRLLPVDTR